MNTIGSNTLTRQNIPLGHTVVLLLFLCLATSPIHAQHYEWIVRGETMNLEENHVHIAAMGLDSSDNVILAIEQKGGITVYGANDTIPMWLGGKQYSQRYDLVKFSSSGDVLWSREIRQLKPSEYSTSLYDLCVDAAGAIYLTGAIGGETLFPSGDGHDVKLGHRHIGFVVKYSTDGNVLWSTELPELPPGKRIGTDGDSTVYLLATSYDASGTALYTFDRNGRLLRKLVDGRLFTGEFGVGPDGSVYMIAHIVVDKPDPNAPPFTITTPSTIQWPSLKGYPPAEELAWLRENRLVMLRIARDGSASSLFEYEYPRDPLKGYAWVNSISFDDAGHPAFASLNSFGSRQQRIEIDGRTFDGSDNEQLLVTFGDNGSITHDTRIRLASYNTKVIRGSGKIWMVMGPVVDSLIVPGDTLRTQGFEYRYVNELAYTVLDSTLQPLWSVRGGGTVYTANGNNYSLVARGHNGGYIVASVIVEHGMIGHYEMKSWLYQYGQSFYVARIASR